MTCTVLRFGRPLVVSIALLAPTASCAQTTRDSIVLRNDCKRVEQIFKTGNPKAELSWAASKAPDCGLAGAVNGAVLLRRLGSVSSPAEVDAALYLAAQVRSAELLEAGLQLATQASTPKIQTLGLVISLRQLLPGMGWTVEGLERAHPGRRCASGYTSVIEPDVITPFPSDALGQLEGAARSITEGSAGDALRNAAACTLYELELTKDSLTDGVEFDERR